MNLPAVTIRNIAAACNVSTATVSRALNGRPGVNPELRATIIRYAKEHHYEVNRTAQMMRKQQSNSICFIRRPSDAKISLIPPLDSREFTRKTGFTVEHFSIRFDEDLITALREYEGLHHPQLFVILGPCLIEDTERFSTIRTKLLFVLSEDAPSGYPSIVSDDYFGSTAIVESLVNEGHSDIALVTESSSNRQFHYLSRVQAFRDTLHNHGIMYDPDNIRTVQIDYGKYFETALDTLRVLFAPTSDCMQKSQPPSAIFVLSDFLAIAVMKELSSAGIKVPEDVSVASFGGWDFAELTPVPTRSWVQPVDSIIKATTAASIRIIQGKGFRSMQLGNHPDGTTAKATAVTSKQLVVSGYFRKGFSVSRLNKRP